MGVADVSVTGINTISNGFVIPEDTVLTGIFGVGVPGVPTAALDSFVGTPSGVNKDSEPAC